MRQSCEKSLAWVSDGQKNCSAPRIEVLWDLNPGWMAVGFKHNRPSRPTTMLGYASCLLITTHVCADMIGACGGEHVGGDQVFECNWTITAHEKALTFITNPDAQTARPHHLFCQ